MSNEMKTLSDFGQLVDSDNPKIRDLAAQYSALFVFGVKAQEQHPHLTADEAARLGAIAFLAAPIWIREVSFDEGQKYDVLVSEYMSSFLKGRIG